MRKKVVLTYRDLEGNFSEEHIWCQKIDNKKFKVDNIPFFASNIAYKDIISVENDNGILYFDSLIQASGHSTLQIVFFEQERSDVVMKKLEVYGCKWESMIDQPYFTVDIGPDIDYSIIKNYLDKEFKRGILDYKEACLA